MFGRFGATLTRDFKPRFEPVTELRVPGHHGRGIFLLSPHYPVCPFVRCHRHTIFGAQVAPGLVVYLVAERTLVSKLNLPAAAFFVSINISPARNPAQGVLDMKIHQTKIGVLKKHPKSRKRTTGKTMRPWAWRWTKILPATIPS